MLVIVLIPGIGVARGGARRWLMMSGFAFQPAEMAKLAIVLYLAHSMARKADRIKTFSLGFCLTSSSERFWPALLLEPDFGTALILAALLYLMLFVGGVRLSHLLATGLWHRPRLCDVDGGVSFAPTYDIHGSVARSIQQRFPSNSIAHRFRFRSVLGPGTRGKPEKLFYLPEAHTDLFLGDRRGVGIASVRWRSRLSSAIIIVRGLRLTAQNRGAV